MVFLSGILFYLLMVILNLYSSISFPGALYLDLIAHPPDRAGPGIVKLQYLVLPFIMLLLTSAILSFLAWRRGSAYAKYLCISFILPLMTVPIGLTTILFFGFTWFTMLIITSFGGLLFLAMFIAFGFAVAQQLNDLKSLAIQQQVRVTEAYQRFVPLQLVKDLGKESILDVNLGDQVEVERSILFSDIRDFTTISEDMTPQQTFALINDYLGRMGPIVRNQSGYIDKFMGDGLMALFHRSASDAVTTAIKMQHDLLEYNRVATKTGQPLIDIGVGVNTGRMMLGTLGEAGRMEGSVISDAVNLAARLEGLTKLYQTGVLISEETYLALNKETFSVRLIDQVAVKGKKKSVMVYEILDADSDEIRILKQSDLQNFDKGFKLYQTQNIKKARGLFENIVANNPDDGVANLYLDRCTKLLETGWNSEIWDGIYRPQIK
jgi:adenylate cyclase